VCVSEPISPHYNQSNIREVLRPDDDLQGNVHFRPYMRHNWMDFATLSLAHMHLLACQFGCHLPIMKGILLIKHTACSPKFVLTFL